MLRSEIVQNIKDCGHCLVEQAETMVGNDNEDITIVCHVSQKDSVRYITVTKDIVPGYYCS